MACCALAAFLISQIIFALDWARERLGLGRGDASWENPVVAWRLGAAGAVAMVGRPARRGTRARLILAGTGGVAAFFVLAALTLRTEAGAHTFNTLTLICTGHGLERLAAPPGG